MSSLSMALHEVLYRDTDVDVIEMLDHLIKRGADINHFAPNMRNSHRGVMPLHVPAEIGKLEPIQWSLEHGADPTVPDRGGGLLVDEADELLRDAYHKKHQASSKSKVSSNVYRNLAACRSDSVTRRLISRCET